MSIIILAASTSRAHRHLIIRTLNEYQILLASSSYEVSHYLSMQVNIDLIIVDLDAHGEEGFRILEGLNSKGHIGKTNIIVFPGSDRIRQEIGTLKYDNLDYIKEPIGSESLKAGVKAHLKSLQSCKRTEPRKQIQNIEKALAESERSKNVFLSHLPGMAYRCNYDPQWTMQFVSEGCLDLTGHPSESLLYNRGISYNSLIAYEYRQQLWEEWERILAEKRLFKGEYEIITADGKRKWVLERGQGVYNRQGEVEALEGIILDISDRKEMENDLRYNYEHDTWTGLYNRRYLEGLLRHDFDTWAGRRAVIAINLSTVQSLTLTYGFQYSQELIKKVAYALRPHCNGKRSLFRVQENQFIFYVKAYKDKGELLEFCSAIADTLGEILTIERIGGGIGVLEVGEENKSDIEQLLKNLLIISEEAINVPDREIGIRFFDAEMEIQVNREEIIKRELARIAIHRRGDGFFLQYQPILDLKTNRICSFEALARLKISSIGPVSPMEFIPIAEKTKLIIPLGEIIIYQALSFQKMLVEHGYNDISVSINISAIQLFRDDFSDFLCSCMREVGVNPKNIILEITESVFASNYENINDIIEKLKNCGTKIALDDFGTGYSSLAQSRELDINYLKIDKYFIDKLLSSKEEDAITGDIISMAHKMKHCVIAEGIEEERQRQYLLNNGCDLIQGYLISRPLNREATLGLLKKFNH